MKRCPAELEHFTRWPFRAEDRPDGDHNNGAFDLVRSPELVSRVREATDENGLRSFLSEMNSASQPYMSLGCAAGMDDRAYMSYVEFTFRESKHFQDANLPHRLEEAFRGWIVEAAPEGFAPALLEALVWEYRTYLHHGNEERYLITLYSCAPTVDDHARLLSWPAKFLFDSFAPELG